jgi:phosphopentomutase
MKFTIPLLPLIVLAGCQNAGPDPTKPLGDTTASQKTLEATAELRTQMSQVARTATGGWETLSAEQKAPFLTMQQNDEKKAKDYFDVLVENEREIAQNMGR